MRFAFRLATLLATTVCALLALSGSALAAPPANDNFANAIALSSGATVTGSNVEATTEIGESFTGVGWGYYSSDWYTYTPATKGLLTITSCATFSTNLIAAYGTLGSLAVASNSPYSAMQHYTSGDTCNGVSGGEHPITIGPFPVAAGQPVRIHIGSAFTGPSNQGDFSLRADFVAEPTNNDYANATPLTLGVIYEGSNHAASVESGENSAGIGWATNNTVWYSYTPLADGPIYAELCGEKGVNLIATSGAVNALAIYDLGSMSYAQSYSEKSGCASGSGNYAITMQVQGRVGEPIRFQVGSALTGIAEQGSIFFGIGTTGPAGNDELSNAVNLGNADTYNQFGANYGASYTPATGEPALGGYSALDSVWYRWQSPLSTLATFGICNTWGDLAISVYSSDSSTPDYADLDLLAGGEALQGCPGDSDGAIVAPDVEAGKTYWIRVASQYGLNMQAQFELNIRTRAAVQTVPTLTGGTVYKPDETLTVSNGTWAGTPSITFTHAWLRCAANDADDCDAISGENASFYSLTSDDVGYRVRGVTYGNNSLGQSDAALSAATPVIDFDSDGDGLNNALDSCDAHAQGAGKTNGCPIEGISVTAQPTVTGTPQVDSPLTATTGSAGNDPGLDPNVAAPAKAVQWFSCSSASGVGICVARTGTASSYTPTSADIGRFIRVTVTWTNSDGAEELANSSTTAAVTAVPSTPSGNTNPPSTPTTPAAPVNPLTLPTLPSKASFKGAVKKKGALNLPTFKIACASGGAACGVSVTLTYKKKTIGTLSYSIAPGTTQPLKAKLSAAGLKLVKKAKRGLKTTLTVTATSGGSGKATIKDFTITK